MRLPSTSLAAVILSAGRSTRLGAFKPFVDICGTSPLARCMALFRQARVDVVVVGGFHADEVLGAARAFGARGVENAHFDDGMLSSVQAGLAALSGEVAGAFVLPVDSPLILPSTVRALLAAWSADPRPGRVVLPSFLGEPGHPVLVGAAHFSDVARWDGPEGLRGYLSSHAKVENVAVADAGVILDVDMPTDLERARALCRTHETHGAPSVAECRALFDVAGPRTELPEADVVRIRAHCLLVARVALRLGSALGANGREVSLDRLSAAGLLHDLAKGRRDHAQVGAAIVDEQGWPRVARLVATHSWLDDARPGYSDLEADALFLADKVCASDRLVRVEARFAAQAARFQGNPDALAGLEARREQLCRAMNRLKTALGGRDPETVAVRSVPAEALLEDF